VETSRFIADWFAAHPDLPLERLGEDAWFTVLPGEHKRTIPVLVAIRGENLALESFFLAAPEESREEVYADLLRRHNRSYVFRFALNGDGDVMVLGLVPVAAVTPAEFDRLLGQLLVVADDTFDAALRTGFAGYIEREQAWRASVGAPRNPIS
jgi:hypothetical protein